MSYLDKITVSGTTYDLQDTSAQTQISALSTDMNNINDLVFVHGNIYNNSINTDLDRIHNVNLIRLPKGTKILSSAGFNNFNVCLWNLDGSYKANGTWGQSVTIDSDCYGRIVIRKSTNNLNIDQGEFADLIATISIIYNGTEVVNQLYSNVDDIDDAVVEIGSCISYYTGLNHYLYKKNIYIANDGTETTLADYNVYKIPVTQGDVIFLVQTDGSTVWWNTLGNGYVFRFQNTDDSYTILPDAGVYCNFVPAEKRAIALVPSGVKYLIVTAYGQYAGYVKINKGNMFRGFIDSVSPYQHPMLLTDKNAYSSKVYRNTSNKFVSLSGDYFALSLKMNKDDKLVFDNIILSGGYGTFTDNTFTTTNIPTTNNVFTATSDGLVCAYCKTGTAYNCTYYPANSLKVAYEDIINNPFGNSYIGKAGVAIGTSLTYRSQSTGGYLQYLPALSGATIDNQGVGSSVILDNGEQPSMMDVVTGYSSYADKDFCIFEGFVNDWYYNGASIGTWKDTVTTSVCGCVRNAINHMLTENPDMTIIMVLDPVGQNSGGVDCSSLAERSSKTQMEFYDEVAKVAESMGITVIPLYKISGMNEKTPYYFIDNIHPSSEGAEQTANTIWSIMKNIPLRVADAT